MNYIIKAVLLNKNVPETFSIRITQSNYLKIIQKLKMVYLDIINILKNYKTLGYINSIKKPKTSLKYRNLQPGINDLIKAKLTIRKSIRSIIAFYK